MRTTATREDRKEDHSNHEDRTHTHTHQRDQSKAPTLYHIKWIATGLLFRHYNCNKTTGATKERTAQLHGVARQGTHRATARSRPHRVKTADSNGPLTTLKSK